MSTSAEFNYEMGYTSTEFDKVLNGGFTGDKSEFSCQQQKENCWLISRHGSAMNVLIQIEKKQPRVLGSISLPVLQVHFSVTSSTTEQTDFFFSKFFKYFHKGGG